LNSPLVSAVVLAGGHSKPDLLAATGVPNRALLQIEGETMLLRVVRALQASGTVRDIHVVGDVTPPAECYSHPDTGDFVENVLQAARVLPGEQYILYTTADIPFLTPQAVTDFVSRSLQSGADMCYPIIPIERCQQQFPNMRRTALSLREGRFTGGNLLMVRARIVHRQAELLRRAFASRKSVWGMATLLGWQMIVRLAGAKLISPHWLSIAHIKHRVQQLMGATVQEIITDYAEIGVDIDNLEHLHTLVQAGYRINRR
jgi:2-phospho-L-lactate guanylyltransferase (CobY/MobA/RfbA family)